MALVLGACGRSERTRTPAAPDDHTAIPASGPDALVLRFPRSGGLVHAYAYPSDSEVWVSSDKVPPLERILGFDDEAGSVSAVDTKGGVVRVDLRLGAVSRDTKLKLARLASSDGSTVYGITKDGSIMRLTPAGSWAFKPPAPARDLIPETDGSLLVLADRQGATTIWQMHPPDRSISDTAQFPRLAHAVRATVGDRVYFTVDTGLIGLRSRGLEVMPNIRLDHHARALAATPSGDRIYVALDTAPEVLVVDRYTQQVSTRITLGGSAVELRMDPTGRFLLARPAEGDSAWVINVGTDKLIGAVSTAWRTDLPSVAPNGWLALLSGHDVALVDGATLRVEQSVKKGADDIWYFIGWNGFRRVAAPPAQTLTYGGDSASGDTADTGNVFATPPDSAAPPATASVPSRDTTGRAGIPLNGFTVQFAAFRVAAVADSLARTIVVDGAHPRVLASPRAADTVFRVVLGPYPTKDEALRAAKASGASYWIYPGVP